jgi:hypothetical protein
MIPMDLDGVRAYRTRLDLDGGSFFDDWPIEPKQRAACRATLIGCLDALIALGPGAAKDDALDVLRQCIEAYNELDEGFICTIEREELCDHLYEIGDLCGLKDEGDWVDEWRDW